MEKIMTNRELYNDIIAKSTNEDWIAKATAELEKLDKRNAQRSSKPSKTQLENEPIKAQIMELFTSVNMPMTASEVMTYAGGFRLPVVDGAVQLLSVQKISSLCRQLATEGKLVVEEVKIPKKGKQKQYSVITSAE